MECEKQLSALLYLFVMKLYTVVFTAFCLCFVTTGFAQTEIKEKFFSKSLKDTLHYKVYLPTKMDESQKYPVIYALSYGVLTGDYLRAQLNYFEDLHYPFPKTIVVLIEASMDRIGFIYKTGLIAEKGLDFIESIKNEIIPRVERAYHTSAFRTYLGHSYAASYGSYLIQYRPDIFKGYILMAPEKVGDFNTSTPFKLNERTADNYIKNDGNNFCYICTGELDDDRRLKFAADFSHGLSTIDSNKLSVKREVIPTADHRDILVKAFLNGLGFIYQKYNPDYSLSSDGIDAFEKAKNRISIIYGMEMEKKQDIYKPFLQLAVDQKDSAGLLKSISYFSTDKSKSYDMFYFGNFCLKLKLTDHAEKYFDQGIKLSFNGAHVNMDDISPLASCYSGMADVYLQKKNPAKAWEYLEKVIATDTTANSNGSINEVDTYYAIAQLAFDNNYKVKEGLAYLKKCEALRKQMQGENHWNFKYIYLLMGKGYSLLNDKANAKIYLQKTLALDPNQKEAQALLLRLD